LWNTITATLQLQKDRILLIAVGDEFCMLKCLNAYFLVHFLNMTFFGRSRSMPVRLFPYT
jgi:hypothetical protein